jgi:cytochrome b6-f complex iron-sulfur subunit
MSSCECDRRRFVQVLTGALGVIGAQVLLPGCGSGGSTDGTVVVTNGQAELTFAAYPALSASGGGVVVDADTIGPLAVVRTGTDTAVALSAVCTHAGCTITYQSGSEDFFCGCHGSQFSITGSVTHGPARTSLPSYPATVGASGITVTLG